MRDHEVNNIVNRLRFLETGDAGSTTTPMMIVWPRPPSEVLPGSLGQLSVFVSFIATMAERFAVVDIPAAIFPIVVPLAGHMTYASNLASLRLIWRRGFDFVPTLSRASASSRGAVAFQFLVDGPSRGYCEEYVPIGIDQGSMRRTEHRPRCSSYRQTADGMPFGIHLLTSKAAFTGS